MSFLCRPRPSGIFTFWEYGLAVIAHIRHVMTNYDELLSKGCERFEARETVKEKIFNTLATWQA